MSQNKNEWDILSFAALASKAIETHFKKILVLFGALIITGAVWSYMSSVEQAKQKESFQNLFEVTKVYEKKKQGFDEAKEQEEQKKREKKDDKKTAKKVEADKAAEKAAKMPTGDLEKDYGAVVKDLHQFVANNSETNAAGEAALTLSEIYEDYDQGKKGAEVLSEVLKKRHQKDVLYFVMQMRAGDLWASARQCDKAVSYWQVVAEAESFVSQQAQLKLGVCLQELGRLDEAKSWFEKIKLKDPNSAEGFSAKRYIRFLQFKKQNKIQNTSEQKNNKPKDKKS